MILFYYSMASVCGGCLALQDAGVPIKCSIAGIAMGLVLDTKEFGGDGTPLILSDITGSEDASGDMDFKVFIYITELVIPICSYFYLVELVILRVQLDFFSFVHDSNPLYAIVINIETR
jgi:hypothetical protein